MNVVIIGATFGIGYELGKKYLDQCDNLILLGRTQEKLQNLKLEFNLGNKKEQSYDCSFSYYYFTTVTFTARSLLASRLSASVSKVTF